MLKREVKTPTQKLNVSFFEDDTIQIVRQQISKVVDIHQDRLFILVSEKYSRNYYKEDPRNWEALFERLSLYGPSIHKELFEAYISEYRVPAISIPFESIDKEEWMMYPEFLEKIFDPTNEFSEYRILGVESVKSFCLPLEFSQIVKQIPAVSYPIPENSKLFSTLYKSTAGFRVIPFQSGYEGPYFPLLQSITPQRLSLQQIEKMDTDSKHLLDLLSLDPPSPVSINILKAVWFVQLVDTDLGEQVRNRFEQIFYGLTVSEDVPCITFFTGKNDISRHKFFTNNVRTKEPFLDIPTWSSWWTKSKPPRNRPTLVLYRGSSRENYDRISISASDIAFVSYRDHTNTTEISKMRVSLIEWFNTLDAIVPYIKTTDLVESRWSLQDVQYDAKYKNPLSELDTRRLNCVSGIFDELKTHKTVFRFLRTDYAADGLTSTDIRILEMLRYSPFLTPQEITNETNIPIGDSTKLLAAIKTRIDEEPNLLTRSFRGFPLYKFTSSSVIATDVYDIDRSVQYLNILNFILSNPVSKNLDKVCPKRVETVEPIISTVNVSYETPDIDFDNLFDYVEKQEEDQPASTENIKQPTRVGKKDTMYNYFNKRLQDFDPKTFEANKKSDYPSECDQTYQPVVLSQEELSTMLDEYNPTKYLPEDKIIEVEDPNGIYVCPEFWCMHDKIPLRKDQLVKVDGVDACPECKGKVRGIKDVKSDTREFSVMPRAKGHLYPKFKKDQANLPCCFKTPSKEKKLVLDEDKYYILGSTKTHLGSLRFAYLPQSIIDSLHIDEKYALVLKSGNRIQTGLSAFFRVGLGRPAETLPTLFGIDKSIGPPRENVKMMLKATFMSNWLRTAEPTDEIDRQLKQIKPFDTDDIARENVNKIISSIDEAYSSGTLQVLQELEYCAIILGIDVYNINLEDESMSCTFFTPLVKSKTRGIVILQKNNEVDCLCHVVRTQRKFEYRANIFSVPFKSETIEELNELRNKACSLSVPSFQQAVGVIYEFLPEHFENLTTILDPYGRAQGIFVPNKVILPFKNTPFPDLTTMPFVRGYSELKDVLPDYTEMRLLLNKAKDQFSGYKVDRDIYSGEYVTELLLVSGLRVPVVPFKMDGQNEEVFQTIMDEGETDLVFGKHNEVDRTTYKTISYSSEIFEFLIFQLSKDIHDMPDMKKILSELKPNRKKLEAVLKKWFDSSVFFHAINTPIDFLSKIRTPCGQLKNKNVCDNSHMCGWDGKCKIEIRNTFSSTKIFNKLLGTLLDNPKVRYSVLDGLITPFFSTILYLELPNETILTDYQLKMDINEAPV
jgi:hypothetical protein